eukprot:UN07008
MACSLISHINVSIEVCFIYDIGDLYIVSAFLRCHHFCDAKKTCFLFRLLQQKLALATMFSDRNDIFTQKSV